jgi:hypothetical protein
MVRCTGTPTSTFGGGGGTKLFCSQALNATHANMTKKPRDTASAFCECEGIMPVPQSYLALKQYGSEENFRRPWISTIPLQWNPKPKMMPAVKIGSSRPLNFHFHCNGGFNDNDKDFFK